MSRPTATYRLQFRGNMTLGEAAGLAGYFAKLGISHLYASPIFTAAPDSTHGYDVADFDEIDPVIGGMEGFATLSGALHAEGLGLILDFVPNHMAASRHNPWWRDILQWGADSDYAEHFDIDWKAAKLVVPTLGEPYGEALRQGRFGLELDASTGNAALTYYELRLPLTPPSIARIVARIDAPPFADLARRFAVARPGTAGRPKRELARLAQDPARRALIDAAVAEMAGDQGALHALHEAQVWRAAYWRAAREGLTYRRFFEIADLAGVRVERPRVFANVHRFLLDLVGKGHVQGVRLDHIDGLADPKTYLERLQAALGGEAPFYLLVEKILGPGEALPPSWPVAGTTGYEFAQALAGLFVDTANAASMTAAYEAFLGRSDDYAAMARDTKRRIFTRNLAGELDFLKDLAKGIADRDPVTRDYGADSLRRAIVEFAAALPVYRTYVNVEGPDETDLAVIAAAVEAVKAAREVEDEGAIGFIARLLRLDFPDPEAQAAALVFATRFQQTTGPVMAKALEDTVFYRYNRLIALNEVGGEPDRFGAPVEDFHRAMQARLAEQPLGLSATATHDTKRGEDTRARIYAISEMPEAWADNVGRWSAMLGSLHSAMDGVLAPEPEFEWLFYQALAGGWPADLALDDKDAIASLAGRMEAYMLKVLREAKLRTSWTAPAEQYEEKVTGLVRGALADRNFVEDFVQRTAPLRLAGAVTSLSQQAIKLTAPGVPDIYQGTEFWDLSFVDPDNRRPVDFAARQAALAGLDEESPEALLRDWVSGRAKLRLLTAGLAQRRRHPALFGEGEYVPLGAIGAGTGHLVAFARRLGSEWLVVAATRLPLALLDGCDAPLVPADRWADTRIVLHAECRGRTFHDAVFRHEIGAGDELLASEALARFPVALLHLAAE